MRSKLKLSPRQPGSWGVLRYVITPGVFPDEDPCAFDGWYSERAFAFEVYKLWRRDYPNWVVALVHQDTARFPERQLSMSPPFRERWLAITHAIPK
jgi:hypothetical protein